ncbi:MAG TPA: TonB family protein [Pyrinomonadaceae bacterium]|nr:TonB family protein [Pyrinomonadaceae bacterium]
MPRRLSASPLSIVLSACACLPAAGAHARSFPQEPKQPAGGAAARGIELFRRGDNEAAIKSLRDATKREKSDPEAWHHLGLALAKKGKFKDARKALEQAVALRPDSPAAVTALAYALLRLNETYDAARAAERALALDPRNQEAHYILGVTHVRNNSNSKALEEAEAVLRINPSFSPALYLKVIALSGMSANAVNAATDETQDVRKVLLDKAGERLEEAEAALRRFAELDPKHAEIETLGEQLKTLRLYGGAFGATPGGPEILSAKETTTRARILSKPEPLYTERARQNGTRGTVTLRMVLAADGVVRHILVVRGLPDGLTENSINAARRMKFVPATKDGRAVSQFVTIQYNFNIY